MTAGRDLDMEGHVGATLSGFGPRRAVDMMRAMPRPQLPDAVVFDNDGLLLDTESVWTRAERDLFERRGLVFTDESKREIVGTSAAVAGEMLERGLDEPARRAP